MIANIMNTQREKTCKQCNKILKKGWKLRLCYTCYRAKEKQEKLEKLEAKKLRKVSTKKYQKSLWRKKIKELDAVFSRYIRQRDRDCVLKNSKCNDILQCGHLIRRGNMATRFDERNCSCQCSYHNYLHNQQPEIYTHWFIRKYGQETYTALVKLSREIKQWSIPELEKMIEYYKGKLV